MIHREAIQEEITNHGQWVIAVPKQGQAGSHLPDLWRLPGHGACHAEQLALGVEPQCDAWTSVQLGTIWKVAAM